MSEETSPRPFQWPGNIPVPDPSLLTTEALDREVGHVRELMTERLKARADLVDEKIRSAREIDRAHHEAVVAQLAAQKEAVAKTEATFKAQLDGFAKNLETEIRGLRGQFSDMKDSMGGGDVRASRAAGRLAGKEYVWGVVVVVAAVFASFAGVIFSR